MSMIKISVIIPVLNGMPYFAKALDSVSAQEFSEMEILVVDSGSTDGSREYVLEKSMNDRRIRLINAQKKSMGDQYNTGIRCAKGEYIAFCESDDYVDRGVYKEMFQFASDHNWPDVVKADFYMFFTKHGQEIPLYYSILSNGKKDDYTKLLKLEHDESFFRDITIWNGIYKTEFIRENNIYMNESPGAAFQDTDFILRVHALANSRVYMRKAYYHYRRDNENSSVFKKNTYQFTIWEFIFILKWLGNNTVEPLWLRPIIERLFGLFRGHYGKCLYFGHMGIDDAEVSLLRDILQRFINTQSFGVKGDLYDIPFLGLFLEDALLFREYSIWETKKKYQDLYGLRDFLQNTNKVAIFGCGENGQALSALLIRNGYDGKLLFCDNNKEKWNTSIMQIDVCSVQEVLTGYSDIHFLIPKGVYAREMKRQLLENDVRADHIIYVPAYGLHEATETDWKECLK